MSNPTGQKPARGRSLTVATALAVIALTVAMGAFGVSMMVPAGRTTATATAPAQSGTPLPLNTPIRLSPALNAEVQATLKQEVASGNAIEVAGAEAASKTVPNLTATQLLDATPFARATPALEDALSMIPASTNFEPAYEFASFGDYLEAAGVGCLTSGALTGLAGGAIGKVTTTTVETEAGVSTVATKTTVPTLILSCAIGAAVGLVTFQMGFLQAHGAVDFAGLYQEFAATEVAAFANYENLTAAMYATLVSALHFAQIGFDRVADNAALLQLHNSTFNTELDMQQSGLLSMLIDVPTDYELQQAENFEDLPLWISALSGPGGYYNGYGNGINFYTGATLESGLPSISELYNNVSLPTGTSPAATGTFAGQQAAGLSVAVCASSPQDDVIWGGSTLSPILAEATVTGSGPAFPWTATFAAVDKTHTPTATITFTSRSDAGALYALNLTRGLYNITASMACTGGGSQNAISFMLPFSGLLPTPTSQTLGSFGWLDRYETETGSRTGCGSGITSSPGEIYVAQGDEPPADTVYAKTNGGGVLNMAGANGYIAIPYKASCTSSTSTGYHAPLNPGSTQGFGGSKPAAFTPSAETLSYQVAGIANNATQNAETYWTYIRTLGYTSLSQIPPNCVIPAPYSELPSGSNLGNLNFNTSTALYLAYLQGLGDFYGTSGTFHVCGSKEVVGFTWLNVTFGNVSVNARGEAYLNNGTDPIWANGAKHTGETLATYSSWSIQGGCHASGGCSDVPTSYATTLILAPTLHAIGVPVGENWAIPSNDPTWLYYDNATSNETMTGGYLAVLQGNGTKDAGAQHYGSSTPGDSLYLTSCTDNGKSVSECNVTLSNLSIYFAQIVCGGACNVKNPSAGSSSACGSGIIGELVGLIASIFGGCGGLGGLGALIAEIVLVIVVFAVVIVVAVLAVRAASNKRSQS